MRRFLVYGLVLGLCGGLLVGCGRSLPPADFTFISTSEHNQFDPQRMSWAHDIRIANAIYEPLVTLDFSDMSLHPGVAESWHVSADKRTYTFHLRQAAKWSDGTPVTARDFVYAWRRAMLPDLAAGYSRLMFLIQGAKEFYQRRGKQLARYARVEAHMSNSAENGGNSKPHQPGGAAKQQQDAARSMWRLARDDFKQHVGVKAPDDHTLIVTLERPTPYFLDLVAFATFMPVPSTVVEKNVRFDQQTGMLKTDSSYWSDPKRLVTNGPYVLTARIFRQGLHLRQNAAYWDRKSMANRSVNERIINNPQTALQAYQSGQAQAWFNVPTASDLAARLVKEKRSDTFLTPQAGTYFYNFNCQPNRPDGSINPLHDSRVRRALSMAIDRKTIVQNVTELDQPIARTFIPIDALPAYKPPTGAGVTFNPKKARQLLEAAGYPGGKGMTGLSILYNTGQGHRYIAQAVQAMWKRHLGVDVTLKGVETKVLGDRMERRDYTICRASWFGDYPDPTTWLDKMRRGNGNNDCGWHNAKYDKLLDRAAAEPDEARRLKLLRQAEKILLREQPMALIYQWVNLDLIKPRVSGLKPNAWSRWVLKDARVAKTP